MREIERKPARIGAIGTTGIWLLFILLGFLLPLFPKKDLKTIQIRLDAPQAVQKTNRQAEPAPAPSAPALAESVTTPPPAAPEAAPAAPQPQLAKAAPAPAPQTAPAPAPAAKPAAESPKAVAKATAKPAEPKKAAAKPAPAKPASPTKPAPAKTEPLPAPAPAQQTLTKSVDELMREQQQTKPKKKTPVDWDNLFGDDSPAATSSSAPAAPAKVAKVDALQGSAATSASSTGGAGSASSSSKNARADAAASSSTSAALAALAATTYTAAAANGVSSQVSASTATGNDGKVSLQMTDGSARVLLEPAKPVITLSEAAAALIDTTKNVQISFTVLANGSVPVGDVKITPAAIIPLLVQQEIAAQISRWRFSSASGSARAVFDYTIRKL